MAKIKVILDLKPPINQKKIKILLGQTRYYRVLIQHYFDITMLDHVIIDANGLID
jgi:hypothetical protein